MGRHVMQDSMYYWKTCGSGGHVFHENVLWEDMSSRWAFLTGGCLVRNRHIMATESLCFKGRYVLQKNILRLEMSCMMTCFIKF